MCIGVTFVSFSHISLRLRCERVKKCYFSTFSSSSPYSPLVSFWEKRRERERKAAKLTASFISFFLVSQWANREEVTQCFVYLFVLAYSEEVKGPSEGGRKSKGARINECPS